MPRKKKEPVTGVSSDPENKLTVQKSNPLSALWRSDLTLAEFKIMDTYLARIDSHKPDKRAVRFEKGEIEKLLGVKKINVPELKERVAHLMRPLIIDDGPKSFRGICLFEEAICDMDENGLWQVDLECTQKAMKYFFNVEQLGYYRYKLRCIAALGSRYSYILFLYIEQNRFRKTWEVGFDELKHLLSCENEPTYQQFYRFNDRLLKRCQTEINEKTECHFSYEPVKRGRTVTAIRFTVETLPRLEVPAEDPNQYRFDENGNLSLPGQERPHDFLHSAVSEFSDEEFDQLFAVLISVPDDKLPYYNMPVHDKNGNPDLEFRRYHYLSERLAAMNRADSKKHINNRFAYFLKLLKADAELD